MSSMIGGGEQRVFLRKASGLIRTAGTFDTFVFNIGLISVGLGVGTTLYYGPAFYPGGDLVWASVICGVAMAIVSFGMITWSIVLPRSGGVYVFGSRILPPWLAFTLSVGDLAAPLFYAAIAAFWMLKLGLSPAFAMIGYVSGWSWAASVSAFIVQPWPLFILGSLILILSSWLIASGMKIFLLIHKIVFVVCLLGSLLLIAVLMSGSHADFVAQFNKIMGPVIGVADPYNAIIASGKANGWSTEGAGWKSTVLVSNIPFLAMIGAAYSFAIGGEIKSVAKAQTYGMLGAVVVTTLLWVVTIMLANDVIGYEFLGTATYNIWVPGKGVLTTPTDPTVTLMAGILTGSGLMTLILSMGLVLWMWMWLPGIQSYAVRAMVAWSFDRVAPAPLGSISPTRHTPVVAIGFALIISVICLALFVFTERFSQVIVLIECQVLAWTAVLLAGVFFPYARRHIYEKSPIVGIRLFGLPLMTVACGLGFLASLFYLVSLYFDDIAAGHAWWQMQIVLGIFVVAAIFFFVMKYYRASQGIDINLAFKEIPIE
jgi:amino acid transporter